MEKDKLHVRLTSLDGLRGFAIILVFLSHLHLSFFDNSLPLKLLFSWIYANGVTGVTFLFILSGFLMSTIYPHPQSASAFLQKRYTRIFPLFLTMSAVMFTGRVTGTTSPLFFLEVLFGYALCTYVVWVFVVKKLPLVYGKVLFGTFIALQVVVGLLYLFWVNKLSFAAFFALPTVIHEGFIFLVNATLTLPLGQYVPMLDGVYWTLVAEVLFYVLYPIVVVPLAKFLAHKSLRIKLIFLFCLLPFFGGIHILSYKIFVLSLIQPALFFYFATGVFLGYLYRNHTLHFETFSKKIFSGWFAIIPFFLFWLTIAGVNDLSFLGQTLSPWMRMGFAIPLTFFTAVLLDGKTLFSKFFGSRILAYIGTVSYSIYLSHSLTVHIAELLYHPVGTFSTIVYIAIVFAGTVLISSILFFLLERPYFHKREEKKTEKVAATKYIAAKYILAVMTFVYVIGVFAAFQSKESYNFFSTIKSVSVQSFTGITHAPDGKMVLRGTEKFIVTLSPSQNNLGLFALQVRHTPTKSTVPQALTFTLFEKGSDIPITQATYSLDQFNNGNDFPFGLPTLLHSQGKTYNVSLTLSNPDSADFVVINPTTAHMVFAVDKKQLITHPFLLAQFLMSKVESVVTNPQAQLALFLLLPVFIFSLVV